MTETSVPILKCVDASGRGDTHEVKTYFKDLSNWENLEALRDTDCLYSYGLLERVAASDNYPAAKCITESLPAQLFADACLNSYLLHQAAAQTSGEICLLFTDALLKADSGVVEQVLRLEDNSQRTFLHVCASNASGPAPSAILDKLPLDTAVELLRRADRDGFTALHCASANQGNPQHLSSLLTFILNKCEQPVMSQVLYAQDTNGHTFLHHAADETKEDPSSAMMVKRIITALPARIIKRLSAVRDYDGRTARELTRPGLTRDWFDQIGCSPKPFYYLAAAPTVLIFYTKRGRTCREPVNCHYADARIERKSIVAFCLERGWPVRVFKDPAEDEVSNEIKGTLDGGSVSCLIVFVMAHGSKGSVNLGPNPVAISSITSWMAGEKTKDIPKLLVVQACQHENDRSAGPLRPDDAVSSPADSTTLASKQEADSCTDPRATGSALLRATHDGFSLQHDGFLVMMAATTGRQAYRNLMIPCLLESLRRLGPGDCTKQAFTDMLPRLQEKLAHLEPGFQQLPVLASTLQCKLCLGKRDFASHSPADRCEQSMGEEASDDGKVSNENSWGAACMLCEKVHPGGSDHHHPLSTQSNLH